MLKTRVLTALVMGPVVLSAFVFGSTNFMIAFLMFLAAVAIYETVGILVPQFEVQIGELDEAKARSKWHLNKIRIFCIGIMIWIFVGHIWFRGTGDSGILTFTLLLTFTAGMLSADTVKLAAGRSFSMFLSVVYGTLPWLVLWDLYLRADHSAWIMMVAVITWMNDIGGYFGGRFGGGKLFGDRKLAPNISPKKTWEGAITGLILGLLGALLFNAAYSQLFGSSTVVTLMAILGGIFSQIGDLVESTMKRFSGMKDSGRIFPGHGGFLDRVDGIIFCAPMVWLVSFYSEVLGLSH